jgi:hypothetical protein
VFRTRWRAKHAEYNATNIVVTGRQCGSKLPLWPRRIPRRPEGPALSSPGRQAGGSFGLIREFRDRNRLGFEEKIVRVVQIRREHAQVCNNAGVQERRAAEGKIESRPVRVGAGHDRCSQGCKLDLLVCV